MKKTENFVVEYYQLIFGFFKKVLTYVNICTTVGYKALTHGDICCPLEKT